MRGGGRGEVPRENNLRKTKPERRGEPVLSAKSKRDDKPVFEFPEFDKEEYIAKEFRDARTSQYVVILALLIALISYALVRVDEGNRIIGLFLIFLSIAGLKEFFTLLKVDTSAFEKKNWIGNSLLLFFAWFGMFTLLLNPPFYDMVDPHIDSIDIYSLSNMTEDNVTYSLEKTDTFQNNTEISLNASVMDNSKVENVTLTITFPNKQTETRSMWLTETKDDEYSAGRLKLDTEGTYTFTVNVIDNYDNTNNKSRSVQVQAS